MTLMGNVDLRSLQLFPVRQPVSSECIGDVAHAVTMELQPLRATLRRRMSIGIGVGSRGLARLPEIVRATVSVLRQCEVAPFVFPAMGSHGGATSAGQEAILAAYGVTAASAGAPIRASLETIDVPAPELPAPLRVLRLADEADGVLIINRVRAHTDYEGEFESGLVKMSVIGLGGRVHAEFVHSCGVQGLRELVPRYARVAVRHGKLLGGLATIENGRAEVNAVAYVPAAQFFDVEPRLLQQAKALQPRLPFDQIDLLIVDEMGKDISGTGMDTRVIGRIRVPGQQEPSAPKIGCLFVRRLSAASHGNAVGIGLADVITAALLRQIDFEAMACNVLTSNFLERGKVPLVAPDEETALEWAAKIAGYTDWSTARVARIRDTRHLERFLASEAALRESHGNSGMVCGHEPVPLVDADRSLPDAALWS